jgi:hypothetical protein
MGLIVRGLRWPVFGVLWFGWVLVELGRYLLLGPREAPTREYIIIGQVEEAGDDERLLLSA